MHGHTEHWKRRQFLQALGTSTLAAALPAGPLAAGSSRRVIIAGAGLAGLAAARLLQAQGLEIIVLEARERVGGRVNTLDDVPGHPEGGANVIGPNYGRVLDAARLGNVALRPSPRPPGTGFIINDKRVLRENWAASPDNPLQGPLRSLSPDRLLGPALRENPLQGSTDWLNPALAAYDLPADVYLRQQGYDSAATQMLAANNSYGNTIHDTSMLSLFRVGNNFARAMQMQQPALEASDGNSRIPESIAKGLSGNLKKNVTVVAVRQSSSGISVEDSSGNIYHGDAVILALPLPALAQLRIDAMPDVQREAMASIQYHKVTQVHLLATEPYWSEGVPGSWWTNGPLGRLFLRPSASPDNPGNLTVWINGDDCDRLASMSEPEAGDTVRREVEAVLPEARGLLQTARVVRWANEPLTGGAWATWAPGQIQRYFAALQQPAGSVFFAGEHTARANPGMEGAMESGERAALETLRTLL